MMRNTIKSVSLAILSVVFLSAFTLDLATETNNIEYAIEGEYGGMLTFTGATGSVVVNPDGSAKITKEGNTYTISFSDDVPSLKGLKFVDDDGSYATIKSSNSVSGIVIEDDELTIGATKEGNTWAFSGEK